LFKQLSLGLYLVCAFKVATIMMSIVG